MGGERIIVIISAGIPINEKNKKWKRGWKKRSSEKRKYGKKKQMQKEKGKTGK